MARARNIKPGFFRNEELVEFPYETRLLFIGLWTIADREGRLEDRPKRIKMELFPADGLDVDACLNQLQDGGFILRYQAGDARHILVLAFSKHQNPHQKEQASTIPAPDVPSIKETNAPDKHGASPVQAPEEHQASPADSLNTDSLNTDSLNTDSLFSETLVSDSGGENAGADAPPPAPPTVKPVPKPRATRIPEPFVVTDEMREWAAAKHIPPNRVALETEKFENYFRAESGAKATKLDWPATWRNWLLRDFGKSNVTHMPNGSSSSGHSSGSLGVDLLDGERVEQIGPSSWNLHGRDGRVRKVRPEYFGVVWDERQHINDGAAAFYAAVAAAEQRQEGTR